jgi:signal transduction histidine kinase
MIRGFGNWLLHGSPSSSSPGPGKLGASGEAIALRSVSLLVLLAFIAKTLTTAPYPGLAGSSAVLVLVSFVVFVIAVVGTVVVVVASAAQPRLQGVQYLLIALLLVLTGASAVLAAVQPNGSWQLGPALIACFAALGLGRTAAVATFVLAAASLVIVGAFGAFAGTAASFLVLDALPWFIIFRVLRELRRQHLALAASQAAEAQAATAAERGRMAREMHDVLAHSLSALALQLESTRLLAAARGVDHEVTREIDKAHQLTASGLEDARRAIAAARGDELPGPDRIGLLADAFGQQSGLPVALEVRGEPRELPPDARLAVYRTAQEALTNVRRHATPERVAIELSYLAESTVLVIEDRASAGTPPPAPLAIAGAGYGLTGMRERAELLGGELLAQPTDSGFRVELRLPA